MASADLAVRLRESFRFVGKTELSDPSAWWREPELLSELGPALAELFRDEQITSVVGIEARGFVLAPLVATHLRVPFVEIRKDTHQDDVGEQLLRRTTPPDYRDRSLALTVRRHAIRTTDSVLLVDDWIETGAQATAVRDLVADAEATWVGAAVIVDALPAGTRRDLGVRALLRERSLPWY